MDNYKPLTVHFFKDKSDINQITSTTFENYQNQCFPFPYFMIDYISKTTDYRFYQKLTKTCKYFQAKEKKILVKELKFINYYEENAVIISKYDYPNSKFWITNTLTLQYGTQHNFQAFIPKIYKCEARIIYSLNQNFTFNDFELLVNPNFAEKIYLEDSSILKSDGNYLVVEDVFHFARNAYVFRFSLYAIPNDFDIPSYCKFIEKSASYNCIFYLSYKYSDGQRKDLAKNAIINIQEAWKKTCPEAGDRCIKII